ncbi:MAG: LLM class flavin-dependent oxidoreductase, partial [Candidatus Binataceae bacterium]
MSLKFGIFDHLERQRGISLQQQYDERLKLMARADELGFHGYHLAEHHQSALCMAPSQNVFLAAAARETRRIMLGTMVYLLPFYHPLRLIEEICMLDNLTGGRLQVGVGRGITAVEHTYWGWSPSEAQARYDEVLEIVIAGLSGDT